jgi:hypothetical protein
MNRLLDLAIQLAGRLDAAQLPVPRLGFSPASKYFQIQA